MPRTIRYLAEHNIFEMRTHGKMTLEDIGTSIPECMGRSEWNDDSQILSIAGVDADFSDFTAEGYSDYLIPEMIKASEGGPPGLKRAILVENELSFGVVKMFEFMAQATNKLNSRVFSDRNEAIAWLKSKD